MRIERLWSSDRPTRCCNRPANKRLIVLGVCRGKVTMRKGRAMAHVGSCFCGAVKLEVSGEPEGMGYCHCRSCQSWSGGPVNAFSLWKPTAVRITEGAEHVATFQKTPLSQRR